MPLLCMLQMLQLKLMFLTQFEFDFYEHNKLLSLWWIWHIIYQDKHFNIIAVCSHLSCVGYFSLEFCSFPCGTGFCGFNCPDCDYFWFLLCIMWDFCKLAVSFHCCLLSVTAYLCSSALYHVLWFTVMFISLWCHFRITIWLTVWMCNENWPLL